MSAPDRLLLRGGIVLTMDDAVGDLDTGDVLIEEGAIVAVGRDLDPDARVVDCAGKIVLPGFVNSHHHMFQTALRSYWADALELDYFMQSRATEKSLFHQYTPDDVLWGELGGALDLLAGGTTTVVDTSQCSYTPEHTDAAIDGIRRSGIRCVFAHSPALGDFEPAASYNHPEDVHRLLDQDLGLVRVALGYHVDEELFRLGRDLGVPVFAHVNDPTWGHVLEEFEDEGLLGPWLSYIHCLGLQESTWETIARTGGRVSVSPLAEQTLAMGRPALQPALEHDLTVSFGTDAVSIGTADMFSQMRAAYALQRSGVHEAGVAGRQLAPVSTRDILRMATLGGARAAHVDHLVGSLTPGKRADVLVLDARASNVAPVNHATGAVVGLMDTSNVETVLVDGRVVKDSGRLVDVDVDRVTGELHRSAAALLARSGAPDVRLTTCRRDDY